MNQTVKRVLECRHSLQNKQVVENSLCTNKCFGNYFNKIDAKYYKYSIVLQCESTTVKTPKKLFIHVPKTQKICKKCGYNLPLENF